MNPYRFTTIVVAFVLAATFAWWVFTGQVIGPSYFRDLDLKIPEAEGATLEHPEHSVQSPDSSAEIRAEIVQGPKHMIAKPAPGQPYNAEAERSLEAINLHKDKASHGSIWYKSDYGYSRIGYTRLGNYNGTKDSDLYTCKVHEAAPWTIWGMAYNRENNVGLYAKDRGLFARFCVLVFSSTNHEWHRTGSEFWPKERHAIHWTRRHSSHE